MGQEGRENGAGLKLSTWLPRQRENTGTTQDSVQTTGRVRAVDEKGWWGDSTPMAQWKEKFENKKSASLEKQEGWEAAHQGWLALGGVGRRTPVAREPMAPELGTEAGAPSWETAKKNL